MFLLQSLHGIPETSLPIWSRISIYNGSLYRYIAPVGFYRIFVSYLQDSCSNPTYSFLHALFASPCISGMAAISTNLLLTHLYLLYPPVQAVPESVPECQMILHTLHKSCSPLLLFCFILSVLSISPFPFDFQEKYSTYFCLKFDFQQHLYSTFVPPLFYYIFFFQIPCFYAVFSKFPLPFQRIQGRAKNFKSDYIKTGYTHARSTNWMCIFTNNYNHNFLQCRVNYEKHTLRVSRGRF